MDEIGGSLMGCNVFLLDFMGFIRISLGFHWDLVAFRGIEWKIHGI